MRTFSELMDYGDTAKRPRLTVGFGPEADFFCAQLSLVLHIAGPDTYAAGQVPSRSQAAQSGVSSRAAISSALAISAGVRTSRQRPVGPLFVKGSGPLS